MHTLRELGRLIALVIADPFQAVKPRRAGRQPVKWEPPASRCAVCGVAIDGGSNGMRLYCSYRCRRVALTERQRAPLEQLQRLPASRGFTVAERFWSKVEKTETCWLWRAGGTREGYGLFHPTTGVKVYAHRWSYEQGNGPIPSGLNVLHSCDTPACVNPSHLRLGSQSDNLRDAYTRGRR